MYVIEIIEPCIGLEMDDCFKQTNTKKIKKNTNMLFKNANNNNNNKHITEKNVE